MSAFIQITVGADLGQTSYRLEANADPKELDQTLDLMNKAIGRQQTKQSLAERIMDLRATKLWLASWPEPQTVVALQRMAERNQNIAEFKRRWNAANKRTDWKPQGQEQNWLDSFDRQTEGALKELVAMKEAKEKLIPNLEEQIERLRGIINGDDPIEELEQSTAKIAAD